MKNMRFGKNGIFGKFVTKRVKWSFWVKMVILGKNGKMVILGKKGILVILTKYNIYDIMKSNYDIINDF